MCIQLKCKCNEYESMAVPFSVRCGSYEIQKVKNYMSTNVAFKEYKVTTAHRQPTNQPTNSTQARYENKISIYVFEAKKKFTFNM